MRKILLATLIFAVVGVMAQEKSLQQLGGVYYAYPIESGVAMPDIQPVPDGYVAFNGNAATCSDLCYPVFQNVLLHDTDEPVEIEDIISFTGTYKTLLFQSDDPSVPADDPSMLFLGTNNTLYYPKTGASIGAFRAYFQLEGDIEAGDLPSSVRSFVLNFSDGAECGDAISDGSEETGICPAATKEIADRTGAWYDLSGRKLQVEPTQKGIYVKNGRKFIVK